MHESGRPSERGADRLLRAPSARALRRAAWIAALVCGALAAWGPQAPLGGGPLTRIVVADVSASVGARVAPDLLGRASADLKGDADRIAVVVFGEDARVGLAAGDVGRSLEALRTGRHGSDLAGALELATRIAEQEATTGRRVDVVLATDGRSTSRAADEAQAAVALARAGCARLVLEWMAPNETPPCVTRLIGPGRVVRGEPFSLEVHGVAGPAGARVELLRERAVEDARDIAGPGPFRVRFVRVEESAGPIAYSGRLAPGGIVPAALTTVVVDDPGSTLVLGSTSNPMLDETLLQGAARFTSGADGGLDAALAGRGAVVLANLPDDQLGEEIVATLERFLRRGGRVLLLGGPAAFGPGRWAGRPVERIAPLLSRPPEAEGLLLYVGLDGSGSMARPWEAGAGDVSQDAVVRDAARELIRSAATDTTLVLRRFAGDLAPAGSSPSHYPMDAEGRSAAVAAVGALASPAGATAVLPPLEEARGVLAAHGAGPRHVLLLTDGRISDDPEAVRAALRALAAAGAGVTFAVPGGAEPGPRLTDAVSGTTARLVQAERPEDLAAVFRRAEGHARLTDPVVEDRGLTLTASGSTWLPDQGVAPQARRVARTWPKRGATVLVETDRGEPVVASQAIGAGRVIACATLPGDPAWLEDTAAARRLLVGLARLSARPATPDVRVERQDGDRLLVSWRSSGAGDAPPVELAWATDVGAQRRTPLTEGPDGLLEAVLPGVGGPAPRVVRLLTGSGEELAAFGLDRPAPAEYRSSRSADLEGLALLAAGPDRSRRTPLRPWLAAAAVLLVVGGSVASLLRRIPSRST